LHENPPLRFYGYDHGMITRRHGLYILFGLGLSGLVPQRALANEGEKKKGGGDAYTQMPIITLATRQVGHKRGTFTLESGIFAQNPKIGARIALMKPRLLDGFISVLQPYALTLTATSLVDTNYVANQLQTATDTILGQKGAKVLLGSIILN
jgi:hypothetical protein